jgi:hypothetical protein
MTWRLLEVDKQNKAYALEVLGVYISVPGKYRIQKGKLCLLLYTTCINFYNANEKIYFYNCY